MRILRRPDVAPYALAAIGFVLFVAARSRLVIGDAATYADTILSGHLLERTIHLGYYVLGAGFAGLVAPLGIALDHALILLDALCMAVAVVVSWHLLVRLGATPREASLAAFVLLFSGNVLMQGTIAEIYAPQLLLTVGSYLLFVNNRPAWAGVLHGVAMTLSPTSLFVAGFYAWDAWRKREWRSLAVTAAVSVVIFGLMMAFTWREYLFGVRGFLTAGSEQPYSVGTVGYQVYALVKNFHWALPFLAVGLWIWLRERRALAGLLALSTLFHLPAIFGTTTDGVFLLALYPFIALAVAHGFERVAGRFKSAAGRTALAAVLGLYAVTNAFVWLEPPGAEYRRMVLDLTGRDYTDSSAVVVGWDYGEALRFYAAHEGRPEVPTIRPDRIPMHEVVQSLDPILEPMLVDQYYPRRLSRLLHSADALEERRRRYSLVEQVRAAAPWFSADPVGGVTNGPTIYRLERGEEAEVGEATRAAAGG
jgi:hypothetical protein